MKNSPKPKTICHDFEPKIDYMSVRFTDDSMRNAGIYKDSVVVVHKQRTATDGDIVIVLLGKKLYLRRIKFYNYNKTIILMPENPAYEPINVVNKDEMVILGKVVQIVTFVA